MPPSRNDIRNDKQSAAPTPAAAPTTAAPPPRNDIRNDNQPTPHCPVCAAPFTPIRRQRYCTPACRQAAWRTRHHDPTPAPVPVLPPATRRRDHTVYQCPTCGTRRLGEQWCPDCTRPAVRLDLGGLCPHCDQPITFTDITDQHPRPPASH